MTSDLVEMRGITKRFPGVLANENVDFSVRNGEIHALLGENGSGKSTLMSVLAGLYRPDEGEIFIDGQRVSFQKPGDAINAGIGMVHQHFRLVETFTVSENIILGDRRVGLFVKQNDINSKITLLSEEFGLKVNPDAKVWQLSVGERQRVEILKMLYRGSKVLILDEPTAVLTPQESDELFKNLRTMADSGRAVILITHKLNEVMAVADRITILRGGRSVFTMDKEHCSQRELARQMVGREIFSGPRNGNECPKGRTVLEVQGINAMNDMGRSAIKGISLTIQEGEILGIAGVAGNGQRELAEVITGLRWATSGRVIVDGKEITNLSPRSVINSGVSHIPEDRLGTGLVPGLGAVDNIMLKEYRKPSLAGRWLIKRSKAEKKTQELIKKFDVRLAGVDKPVKMLSGGNLQKLILAREISSNPRLIVAVYPVRGLDIGATEIVHHLILKQREQGAAVLLISEDLEEIFKLSDRIAVIYEGKIAGILSTSDTNIEEVGLLMTGIKKDEVLIS